ncbi:hypothetical protein DRQ53_08040 [bacterium]|nr:MAG: hypothetical protein DRQ53_08040 [bacterium]
MTEAEKLDTVKRFVDRFPGKTVVEIETLIGAVVGITAVEKMGLRRDEITLQLKALLKLGAVYEGTTRTCTKATCKGTMAPTWWPA